jgi:peptidoglycan/xylan/chitin deacetylase (PgdA/CDA1 family)
MTGRKARLAAGLDRLGLGRLAATRTWRGVVTLSYHRVAFGSESHAFEQQLDLLASGCEVVTPDQLTEQALVRSGRRVMVTVDDCYRDSYEVALPLLAARGMRATFFLVSGFLDGTATPWWDEIQWMVASSKRDRLDPSRWWQTALPLRGAGAANTVTGLVRLRRRLPPASGAELLEHLAGATGSGRRPAECSARDFITWEQAREMAAAGMAFGGHTDSHPVLATLPEPDQRAEIERGLERIGAELGARPTTFAYPVGLQGTFTASTKAAAAAAGVRLAFGNYGGYTRSRNWDPLEVRRVSIDRDTAEPSFRWTVGLPAVFARELRAGVFELSAGQ